MAEPHIGDVFIEQAITQAAIAYTNSTYIAREIAPEVQVDKDSGKIYSFPRDAWFRDDADSDRRPGTRAPRSGYTVDTLNYALNAMAQGHPIPDRIAKSADNAIRIYERGAEFCMQKVLLRLERHCASTIMTTGVWGTDDTTATDWDDFSNGDPAANILVAKRTIQQNTGHEANTMVVGQIVMDALLIHPDGLDRYKHTRTGIMSEAEVAQWLGIDRILVGKASRNTADEGATFSGEAVWDDDALVMYVPSTPALDVPAACYTLRMGGIETKRYREEAEAQDVVEAELQAEVLVTASEAGYFFSDIV